MKTFFNTCAAIALVALVGCSEGTTRKDVANAQDKLQKERAQTTETIHEGQQDVADAQRKAQNYTAAKPVTPTSVPSIMQITPSTTSST